VQINPSDWQDLRTASKWVLGLVGIPAFTIVHAMNKDHLSLFTGIACVVIVASLCLYDWRGSR
jgi:hypothetical protein